MKMFRDQSGQGMVEYGLIIALVAIVVIVAITALGGEIAAVFNEIVAGLGLRP
jgi:pilus assembly protein Flp/PilA